MVVRPKKPLLPLLLHHRRKMKSPIPMMIRLEGNQPLLMRRSR
jgi:hypothetical protein